QILYRHSFWRGGVVLNTALSGIDQALWDITGKAYGQPVYKLLGGRVRDRIRVYCHGGPRQAPEILANGFRAIKMGTGRTDERPDAKVVRTFAENVTRMREAVGPE